MNDSAVVWQCIDTAPTGSGLDGPDRVTHPDYVKPPRLLLWTADGIDCGYYDWYYHAGYGNGASERDTAWCDTHGREIYLTHWADVPQPPHKKK